MQISICFFFSFLSPIVHYAFCYILLTSPLPTSPFLPLCFPSPPSPLFSWPPSKSLQLLPWMVLSRIFTGLFEWTSSCNVHRWTCLLFLWQVGSIGVQLNPTFTRSWHKLCCPTPLLLPKIAQLCSMKSATR